MFQRFFLFAVAFVSLSLSAVAFVDYDESVDGDLSSDPANPTPVVFTQGRFNHIINGTVQASGDTRDYLTFTIARGQILSRLVQRDYTDVLSGGGGDRGFHAIIAGDSSLIPSGSNIGSFLGSNHLDPLPPGTDMLPALAAASTGGSGFSLPLGHGTYTYHIQQTGNELTAYSVDFLISPEPSSFLLVAAGSIPWILRRRI